MEGAMIAGGDIVDVVQRRCVMSRSDRKQTGAGIKSVCWSSLKRRFEGYESRWRGRSVCLVDKESKILEI